MFSYGLRKKDLQSFGYGVDKESHERHTSSPDHYMPNLFRCQGIYSEGQTEHGNIRSVA
jgi:hypothetical protein